MDQSLNLALESDKSAKRVESADYAVSFLAGFIPFADFVPGIRLQGFEGQRYPSVFNLGYLRFDEVVDLDHFLRAFNQSMIKLGDMDQALDLGVIREFDKRSEVRHSRDDARNDVAFLICREHLFDTLAHDLLFGNNQFFCPRIVID